MGTLGVLVGMGVGAAGVSADAKLATPMPAPSAISPEAIKTAVLVEAGTFIAPCRGFATGIGGAEQV
jgi:hypothetical protein